MIAIVDYGLGNLYSVKGALEHIGQKAEITNDPRVISDASHIILPGVGAFELGMKKITESKIKESLEEEVFKAKKPLLGICLGLQLLCKSSEEFGLNKGLGWLNINVKKIPSKKGSPVPHVGWDKCTPKDGHPLFKGIPKDALFYFVHSYFLDGKDSSEEIASSFYNIDFTAAAQNENIYGVQFHPEKSQKWGLELLKNFVSL